MREMGADAKKILVGAGQFAVAAIRACLTSLSHHPFAWFLGFSALFLYRFFPSLFHFLLSSAPVLVCTAVLLGTLLSLGQPNIPEIEVEEEEEKTSWNVSALKSSPLLAADSRVLERDVRLSLERSEEPGGGKEGDGGSESKNLVNIEHRELDHEGLIEIGVRHVEDSFIADQSNEPDGVLDEKNNSFLHDLSWKGVDIEEDSDSGSDEDESLSPDASLADIMPMLDELHPLLDVDAPQPTSHSPKVTDGEDSDVSADDDDESDSGSEPLDEGEEIQDEEEKVREDQEDRASEVVTWTEDDEKNLKDIKKLELERNLKMENMIAKRIASRNQRAMADMNLIDLDGIHLQIPPVSTSRQNPFDLPDTAEKNLELPPVPCSAPSVLHPRVNPFDLPYDQAGNGDSRSLEESPGCKGSVTFPQREPFFRRHETFHLGTSFSGEIKRESDNFKPYFVVETAMPEETSITPYQRQMSDLSESKVSSVNEADANSSDLEEEQTEMLDDEPQLEVCSASPCVQNVEHLNGRDSSEEGSLDFDEEHAEKDVNAVDTIVDGVDDEVDNCQPEYQGDKYSERSSTSLPEKSDNGSSPEKAKDEPSKWSSDSVHSSMTETEKPEEATAVEPVYDSSPSALEKSISNITDIGEALFNPDKGDINSASALSTTNVMIPDRSSPLREEEQIDESIESGKLNSSQELHSDMADLPRQNMNSGLTMFKDYTGEEVYEPGAKSSITNMETVDGRLTGDLVSSFGSAESTEIFMEKNAEADRLQEIDEYLLKELDAVGDFNVQSDSHVTEADIGMQSSQGAFKENKIIGESVKMKTSTSTSTEENSIYMLPERDNDASSSLELNSPKSEGQDAVVNPTFDSTERERSLIKSLDINYHGNDLVALDASSVENIDTDFTRIEDEVQKSKSILHEPLDENSAVSVATGDLEVSRITDATVDDIGSSSEDDIEEGGGAPSSVFKPKKTEVVLMSSSEPNNCHKDMDVVEARSLEDIDLAFSKMKAEVITKSADQKSMHVATKPELQVVSVAHVADLSLSPQTIERDTATSAIMNSQAIESDGSSTLQDEKHEELHSRIQGTEEPEIDKQNSDNMEMAHAEGTKDDKLQQRKSEVAVETIVLTVNVVQQADSANEILERPDEIENMSNDLHSTKSGKTKSSSSSSDSSSSSSDSE